MTSFYTTQSNIITFHDAITDSPVYRASTLYFDKQLDVFLKWIDDLAQETKIYAEKLKQLNTEWHTLAGKLNPTSLVNYQLLDSKIVDMAANNFGDAMKTNLTFKMKTVSDLEGKFTGPIEKFAGEHIHAFKDFRKQHEHALMEYEGALGNYGGLSNTDSTATIHSTTQRLHSARKKYVEMSSEHIARIAKLRHELEHTLVEQYSSTISSRKDFYNDAQVWKQLNTMLFSWADWLAEDKRTYQLESRHQQLAQQTLEKEYLDTLQLKLTTKPTNHSTKSGYLMTRSTKDASSPWKRQWFFIHDGYFGSCKVMDPQANANIIIDDCVPLQLCQLKNLDSSDRRFCFELTSNQHPQKSFYILQAENERDLQDWASVLSSSKSTKSDFDTSIRNRPSSILIDNNYDPNNDIFQARSPASLITKSKSTTVVSTPTDVPVTLSTNSDLSITTSNSPGSTMFSHLSGSPPSAFKVTFLDRQNDMSLTTATSLTPMLLHGITHGLQRQHSDIVWNNSKSIDDMKLWGTPRTILPSPQDATRRATHHHGENYKSLHGLVVWPISQESISQSLVEPDLPGYTDYLKDKNQELRGLFHGVSPQEVVLDVFVASFLKKQDDITTLEYQQGIKELKKSSTMGNFYWGHIYVTQDTFWFYSCLSCNCITTIALKLENIKDVQIGQDTEVIIHFVDHGDDDTTPTPFLFSVMMDDVDSIAEKLRYLLYNAKLAEPMQLRNVYRKITTMSSTQSPAPSISTLASLDETSDTNNSKQHILPTRMTSSNTTTTIDAATTLITPLSNNNKHTKVKKSPAKKKVITKPFVDPDTLPEHVTKPPGPLECNCEDHLDRKDAEMELPISAKRLYELMFSDESTAPPTNGGVWNSKTEGIDGHDLRVSPWELITDEQEGQMKRTLKYWMPVANPVVRMKEAEVVETQILLKKQDYLCYVVQISTKTEALPFADAFIPSVRYCITYVDDSRCRLTCHLGVRWTKWVMAKIIVTKAALAGMSDSVNIFVSILKEAANAVQLTVENLRQSARESVKQIVSDYENESDDVDIGDDDDDDIFQADDSNGLDDDERRAETTAPYSPGTDIPIKSTTAPALVKRKSNNGAAPNVSLQPPNASAMTTKKQVPTTTTTTNSIFACAESTTTTPVTSISKSKISTHHHRLVKEKLTDASGQETPSLVKVTLDSIWPPGLWTFGTLLIGYLLYMVCISTLSSNCAMDHHQETAMPTEVVSHALYLRDLDDGFINKSLRPPYAESQSYTLFLQTRKDEQEYIWYATQHYRLALEYKASREQLGLQRQNMITTFHALNTADSELLETEYLNWLLDNRQRCRGEQQQQLVEFNNTASSNVCDQIITQIGTYF